ncbi:ATP-binding cassette domain-containing protein [Paenibacillus filicis]|uniref:ATP-binding cassette domain-containing protein n=1 Tax=Paenibacillus gyeongsangnamensis TaxID=3388067 RepID=A0ABT4Q5X3_9BACL|nr:ATP-binding cassette domain-containing protein [Paenibacillus filicis]MCZ8512196.1 ATP-binding cassette domain-containing protein [Paenibacillus filicis]
MSEAVLEVKSFRTVVKDKHRELILVDSIDFAIGTKEVVALVGESGSGKSMTSLSIMQLLPRSVAIAGGEVRFCGTNLVGLNKRQMARVRGRRMSMIFQEPMTSLNPVLTVGTQLTEAIVRHLGASKMEAVAVAEDWIRRVGFPEPARIRN